MTRPIHTSAKPSHYNREAKHYDTFNESASQATNTIIGKFLKKHRVKTVLDLTCGTGSQVFWLAQRGYSVVGADINANMLKIAKKKQQQTKWPVTLLKGDMRTLQVGQFDAVITIFNAVGHLTKTDFSKAMKNIYRNLKPGGIYVFDIFNLNYLLADNHITRLTIDWQQPLAADHHKTRTIQYSTIDHQGILASYTISYEQKSHKISKIAKSKQTLQVYTAAQLQDMLKKSGFNTIGQYSLSGSKFHETRTERILTIAKKR